MDLRTKVQNTDIIFNLFPERFTICSLEQVYGDILKEKVVNSAFRRTFTDKLEITNEMVKTGGHRPSYLYKYKENPIKIKMGEMIDIYNPDTMKKTGEIIDKSAAHRFGIWHSSIHLIIMNKDKTKVLLQKRSNNKDLYPNMLDISVGGHIMSRESDIDAVKRELMEETTINILLDDIEQFAVVYNYLRDYEIEDGTLVNRLVKTYYFSGSTTDDTIEYFNLTKNEKEDNNSSNKKENIGLMKAESFLNSVLSCCICCGDE
jgi:8-oxo-dGTP pyrophosphatase MutT (NUDIX family)